jgi:hypothetical protein
MKIFLLALLCLTGVAHVSAAAATAASGKIIKGGAAVFTFSGAASNAAQTVTITATKPIFTKNSAASAASVTSVVDSSRRGTVATDTTAATNAGGTTLTITYTGSGVAQGVQTITLTSAVIDQNIQPGIYSVTHVSQADTTPTAAFDILYCDTNVDAVTVGIPTLGSYLQGVDAATATFKFGLQEAQSVNDVVTVTASQAIFHPSFAAAEAGITTLTQQLGLATATDKKTGTPTLETDATGKIMKLTLKAAFDANTVMALAVPTTIMNVNPATEGLVTLSVTTTTSTTAATNYYPVFSAASTALLYSATVGTDEKAVDPVSLAITIFPQNELANNGLYTVTSSTAIFSTTATTATCKAAFHLGTTGAETGECTAASDTTGKILTITMGGVNKAFANFPITFEITDTTAGDIANNADAAGAGPTLKAKASAGDTTETAAVVRYYLFNAALTPFFNSAAVSTLTGLAAPGNLTLQFVPQGTVAGATSGTTRTVTFTANAAVFDATGSYPGSACQGDDCIVCTSSWQGYSSTVPCTAASDSTGKVLTVTATTASTATDSNDFTADKIGQIVLTNHQVNPNATAVTFTVATGVDTTATAAGTGYTTTSVAGAAPSPPGATTTGGWSTATTTVSFTGYTYVAGTATTNFANVVGCAYAKTVSDATTSLTSHMCTASSGPTFTYMTGASTTNTASAARRTGTSVAVGLKMYHSLISQTASTAAVTAVGTSLTAINANLATINTAAGTGFSTAQITATGMTAATWTHSSAAVVVPSMMAMFSALVLVLMQ